MSTTTSLQMVNRFMRKYRLDTVADFSSPQALAALDCLNDAKEEILDSRSWSFDQRESAISTIAVRTGVDTGTFTNGSLGVAGTTTENIALVGDYALRVIPTDSSDRANTAHRVSTMFAGGGVLALALSEVYSGATVASDMDMFVAEYQFPSHANGDTQVKQLLSMTNQERPVRLVEIDKNFHFDRLITRLHDSIGSDPDVVYYGRPVSNTVAVGGTNNVRDGFIVFPVPTSSARLDYTYQYAYPTLALVTDTLSHVPEKVINCIVELAFGFSLNTKFGNDPNMADRVIKAALIRAERLHRSDRKMPNRSKPVRSMDNVGGTHTSGRRISNDLIAGY